MSFAPNRKTLCVITGASRGIGEAIATALSKLCSPDSTFLLIARNENDLRKACQRIVDETKINAVPLIVDLARCQYDVYDKIFRDHVNNGNAGYDQSIFVHNAATIGPVEKRSNELNDLSELRAYSDTNFHSTVLFNTAYLKNVTEKTAANRLVVNVSSGAAYGGFQGMHLYASCKAARDAFFRILSVEEPSVRVLNFNPGPIVTDMQHEVERRIWSEDIQKWSHDGKKSGTFPGPDKAAEALIRILLENQYKSGSFVNIHESVLHFDYRKSSL